MRRRESREETYSLESIIYLPLEQSISRYRADENERKERVRWT